MTTPRQGEVWWAEAEDKRRPVLVVTRSEAVPVLTWILVAPVTRTVRAIPTEVALGPDEGLPSECAATFDNLQPIRRSFLTSKVGALSPSRRLDLCRSLAAPRRLLTPGPSPAPGFGDANDRKAVARFIEITWINPLAGQGRHQRSPGTWFLPHICDALLHA